MTKRNRAKPPVATSSQNHLTRQSTQKNQVAQNGEALGASQHQFVMQAQASVYQHPGPPPEVLKRFDDALPGGAKMILDMAQDEASHRRRMETMALEANIAAQQKAGTIGEYQSHAVFRSDLVGQIAGAFVCIGCIVAGTYLAIYGHEGPAAVIFTLPTAAIIKAFFVPKRPDIPKKQ